jgi:four helix bundle protein
MFSLTDQIRRSSRAIGANLAEAWQKRRYEAHFVSKLSDSDAEQAETQHWLDTASTNPHPSAVNFQNDPLSSVLRRLSSALCHPASVLWQINGRSNTGFEEWMKLDMEYIDQWSLWLDAKILFKTLPAVLKGSGAA